MKHELNTSAELTKIFFELSYFNEMKREPFKPRAYQLASETVEALGAEIEEVWRRDGIKGLLQLPGIGKGMADKIDEYLRTGHIKIYDAFKADFPVDIWSLSRVEGLGPRHIEQFYREAGVRNLEDLKAAVTAGKISGLPRWGDASQQRLARGLKLLRRSSGRLLLGELLPVAEEIVINLSKVKGVKRCTYAGSLRRKLETIGDIDLLATSDDPDLVMETFVNSPWVSSIHEKGKTKTSVRLKIGVDADLRVVPDKVYGAALQYFTGSKRHNVLLRELALSRGYTLSEYGLFTLGRKAKKGGRLIACETEAEIYEKLEMAAPPPEIREGNGEIEAACEHRLPNLIPYGAVRGDLQVQTNWTDGSASIEEMARAAKKSGLDYFAVTDHTKALAFIKGLNDKRVFEQREEIRKVNRNLRGFEILAGTECDILEDGSLDLKDATLAALEWVGVSIHSHFKLTREQQTKRIVKAISNPNVDCFFHPTTRLIGKRDPIDFDLDEVMAAAKQYRVALEIDAYPDRCDLRDVHVRAAIKAGVMLTIDTDAHRPEHFRYIALGEAIARRGWAEKKHFLNTKSLKELKDYLAKKTV